MSQRATRMFASGAGVVALVLLMPLGEINPPMTPLLVVALALPWLALLLAMRFPHPALSHGAFPLSLLPAVIHVPELHAHPAWSGLGGAASIAAITLLFMAWFRATVPAPSSPPPVVVGTRFRTAPGFAHLVAALVMVAPVVALWLPILAEPTPPTWPMMMLAAAFSLAFVTVTWASAERSDFTALFFSRQRRESFRSMEMNVLLQRRRRFAFGLTVAVITGLVGLIWYLRRGFA